jgi:phosphonate metabolism protein (transferase hexapeptide repeat family)
MEYFEHFPPKIETNVPFLLTEKPTIDPTCIIRDSYVGAYTQLMKNTMLVESSFGDYSYTAGNVQIIYAEIGKYCSIANSVRINPGNHAHWRVSQHHMTYRPMQYGLAEEDDHDFFQWRRDHKCIIGHDVWIGHGASIMPGVKIGTGAIIGTGAVVTKDVGPYEVAVGVPAKVIKKRFSDQIIDKLLKSEWWNWSRESLEENFKDLFVVDTFLAKHT